MTNAQPERRCDTCAWWERCFFQPHPSTRGACHRFPPTPISNTATAFVTLFPETHEATSCGEWSAKP